MRLTRRQALTKSIEHWQWLVDHGLGRSRKSDYFSDNNLPLPESRCYLCEYEARSSDPGHCKLCMELLIWGSNQEEACTSDVSPHRSNDAKAVLRALKRALKRFDAKYGKK